MKLVTKFLALCSLSRKHYVSGDYMRSQRITRERLLDIFENLKEGKTGN